MAYNLFIKVGLFQDERKVWIKLPYTDQTWVKFRDIFAEFLLDLQRSWKSAITSGYSKNATKAIYLQYFIVKGIINLAIARTADRQTIYQLWEMNLGIISDLKIVNEASVASQTLIGMLYMAGHSDERKNPQNPRNWLIPQKNGNYCWTQRYCLGKIRTSETCTAKELNNTNTVTT